MHASRKPRRKARPLALRARLIADRSQGPHAERHVGASGSDRASSSGCRPQADRRLLPSTVETSVGEKLVEEFSAHLRDTRGAADATRAGSTERRRGRQGRGTRGGRGAVQAVRAAPGDAVQAGASLHRRLPGGGVRVRRREVVGGATSTRLGLTRASGSAFRLPPSTSEPRAPVRSRPTPCSEECTMTTAPQRESSGRPKEPTHPRQIPEQTIHKDTCPFRVYPMGGLG